MRLYEGSKGNHSPWREFEGGALNVPLETDRKKESFD